MNDSYSLRFGQNIERVTSPQDKAFVHIVRLEALVVWANHLVQREIDAESDDAEVAKDWQREAKELLQTNVGPDDFVQEAVGDAERDAILEEAAEVVEKSKSWGLSPTKLEAVQSFQAFAVMAIRAQKSDSTERAALTTKGDGR